MLAGVGAHLGQQAGGHLANAVVFLLFDYLDQQLDARPAEAADDLRGALLPLGLARSQIFLQQLLGCSIEPAVQDSPHAFVADTKPLELLVPGPQLHEDPAGGLVIGKVERAGRHTVERGRQFLENPRFRLALQGAE